MTINKRYLRALEDLKQHIDQVLALLVLAHREILRCERGLQLLNEHIQ